MFPLSDPRFLTGVVGNTANLGFATFPFDSFWALRTVEALGAEVLKECPAQPQVGRSPNFLLLKRISPGTLTKTAPRALAPSLIKGCVLGGRLER